ncbi:late competence development ComFB family protein [Oscillatoria sp. CS-180]|uniref:late competence development ComFB family protein n=1 Tax=Oscillatoria sp. CS-180 TaxID=3021720 RepID=UPI00232BA97A|nr:late competence development ComFB family protein [Oscillatoria sp. CS-180]MDB9528453.1 late competence development ComFB family protein [Oscillatoria sp. CS-180]
MNEANLPHGECSYVNVMESLVTHEVTQQFRAIPTRVRRYLKAEEVVTYALNRLPALYASSKKGWQYQQRLAKQDLHRKIKEVVRQAIMAVQIDPIRISQPIETAHERRSEAVLQALRDLFNTPDLDWDAALAKLTELQSQPSVMQQTNAQTLQAWQPQNPGGQVAWTHRRRPRPSPNSSSQESVTKTSGKTQQAYGWDNVMYRL